MGVAALGPPDRDLDGCGSRRRPTDPGEGPERPVPIPLVDQIEERTPLLESVGVDAEHVPHVGADEGDVAVGVHHHVGLTAVLEDRPVEVTDAALPGGRVGVGTGPVEVPDGTDAPEPGHGGDGRGQDQAVQGEGRDQVEPGPGEEHPEGEQDCGGRAPPGIDAGHGSLICPAGPTAQERGPAGLPPRPSVSAAQATLRRGPGIGADRSVAGRVPGSDGRTVVRAVGIQE